MQPWAKVKTLSSWASQKHSEQFILLRSILDFEVGGCSFLISCHWKNKNTWKIYKWDIQEHLSILKSPSPIWYIRKFQGKCADGMTAGMISQLVYSHYLHEPFKHQHKDQQCHDRPAKLLKHKLKCKHHISLHYLWMLRLIFCTRRGQILLLRIRFHSF